MKGSPALAEVSSSSTDPEHGIDSKVEPSLLTGTKGRLSRSSMSPLRYPGAKRKIIPAIRQLVEANNPPPKLFIEPFCGGSSVSLGLLELDIVEKVLLSDFDPLVSAFWKEAAVNGKEFIKDMRELEVTLEQWDYWRNLQPQAERELALKFLFLNRTTFSGIVGNGAGPIGGRSQAGEYKIDCRFNKDTLSKQILNVHRLYCEGRILLIREPAHWSEALERAKGPAAEFDPKETILYLDPPYIKKASRIYTLAFEEKDHRELATHLLKTEHRWILSYDAEPLVLDLYRGNLDVREFRVVHNYTMTGTRNRPVPGREVLFTNLPVDPTATESIKNELLGKY